jgi:hypothetical protein
VGRAGEGFLSSPRTLNQSPRGERPNPFGKCLSETEPLRIARGSPPELLLAFQCAVSEDLAGIPTPCRA